MDQQVLTLQNDMVTFRALEAQHHQDNQTQFNEMKKKMEQAMIDFRTLQLAVNARPESTGGGGKSRLDFHAAKDVTPTAAWHGLEDKKVHWKEFSEETVNYATALYRDAKEVLEEVERSPEESEVDILHVQAGEPDMVELLNATLYGMLYKYTADNARKVVTSAGRGNGLQAWHDLCHYARPVSVSDEHTEYFRVLNPERAKDEAALGMALNAWTSKVHEFEKRYAAMEERSKKVGLLALVPKETYDKRLLGITEDLPYKELLVKVKAIARDRTMTNQREAAPQRKAAVGGATPMDLDTVSGGADKEKEEEEGKKKENDLAEKIDALNAIIKNKGWGKGGKSQNSSYQPWYPDKSGKAGPKGGKANAKGGKGGGKAAGGKGGKSGNKELVCYNCGGKGHPARLCPTHQELGEECQEGGEGPEEEAEDFFEVAEWEEQGEESDGEFTCEPCGQNFGYESLGIGRDSVDNSPSPGIGMDSGNEVYDSPSQGIGMDSANKVYDSPSQGIGPDLVNKFLDSPSLGLRSDNYDQDYDHNYDSPGDHDHDSQGRPRHDHDLTRTTSPGETGFTGDALVLHSGIVHNNANGGQNIQGEDDQAWETMGTKRARAGTVNDCWGNLTDKCKMGNCREHQEWDKQCWEMRTLRAIQKLSRAPRNYGREILRKPQTPKLQTIRELDSFEFLNNFESLREEEEDNDALFGMEEEQPTRQGRWVKITAVADSGAVVSVMPDKLLPFIGVSPNKESRAKKKYRGAGGEPIPALGEKKVEMMTKEGQKKTTTWRTSPVKRPLLSLSQVTAKGHKVQLDSKDPHILNVKSGQKTKLRIKGQVFELDLWVKVPEEFDDESAEAMDVSVFTRPEQ